MGVSGEVLSAQGRGELNVGREDTYLWVSDVLSSGDVRDSEVCRAQKILDADIVRILKNEITRSLIDPERLRAVEAKMREMTADGMEELSYCLEYYGGAQAIVANADDRDQVVDISGIRAAEDNSPIIISGSGEEHSFAQFRGLLLPKTDEDADE